MTSEEIQNLSGVELAREVAEKVMGWTQVASKPSWYETKGFACRYVGENPFENLGDFRPDREGNAMLEVVERMKHLGWWPVITENIGGGYITRFMLNTLRESEIDGIGTTIPESVARAALLTVAGKEAK